MNSRAYLILENGKIFEGKAFGAKKETVGELVFTTAMTGYLETLTDPSYYGQVVIQTFPLIGNYGVIPADFESGQFALKAYIVRNVCQEPSNFRCEGLLDTFLQDNDIPGLCEIDTRSLTRIVREYGVMNCKLTYSLDNLESDMQEIKSYRIEKAVENVTCKEIQYFESEQHLKKVVLMDLGVKRHIREALVMRGCDVVVVPASTTAEEIIAMDPDGIMLSNGPGDPAQNPSVIEEIKKLCDSKIPMFGICLGHQLLAMAQGAYSEKLHYGHRGGNQPAKDVKTGRILITSQNHGYAVVNESVPENAEVRFVNGNDGTCEGIDYLDMPAFSVQFHPEACGGPLDTSYLFDRFMALMG